MNTKTETAPTPTPELIDDTSGYLSYWNRLADHPEDLGLVGEDAQLASSLARVNAPVLRFKDEMLRSSLRALRQPGRGAVSVTLEDGLALMVEADSWYRLLGSFNNLEGATSILGEAGDTLLAIANFNEGSAGTRGMRSVAARFFQEAAFSTDSQDLDQFAFFAERARETFRSILEGQGKELTDLKPAQLYERLQLVVGGNDLFQELNRRRMVHYMNTQNAVSDEAFNLDSFVNDARRQQAMTLQEVQDIFTYNQSIPADKRILNNGHFFEVLTSLSLYNDVVAPNLAEGTEMMLHNSVRLSTVREDAPHDSSPLWDVPNMGYDVVAQKYDVVTGKRVGRIEIQVKSKEVQRQPGERGYAPRVHHIVKQAGELDYVLWTKNLLADLKGVVPPSKDAATRDWVYS